MHLDLPGGVAGLGLQGLAAFLEEAEDHLDELDEDRVPRGLGQTRWNSTASSTAAPPSSTLRFASSTSARSADEVLLLGALGGALRDREFHGTAGFEEVGAQALPQRVREPVVALGATHDDGAVPVLDLDDPEQDETVQRLADRRTADLEALLELGLRGQAGTDGKGVALDQLEQLSGHGLCEALAERRLRISTSDTRRS